MSEVATRIDAIAEMSGWLRQLGGMYIKDLKHIPVDKLHVSPGGAARTPADFTYETAAMLHVGAMIVKGEEMGERPSEEATAAKVAELTTTEAAIACIQAGVDALANALDQTDEANMSGMTMAPWGQPLSRYQFCQIMVNHVMYHDAQLNYIQSLLGDAEVHWME